MTTTQKHKNNYLNIYSLSIVITFICAMFAMHYRVSHISLLDFFQTLPLIVLGIYFSERLSNFINQPESKFKNNQLFIRDLLILSFSFLLGCLVSLIFSYNISDVKGWWSLIIYFITIYGVLFSTVFSIIGLLIKNHKKYTLIFAFIIFTLVSVGGFFPSYIFVPYLGNIETFYVATSSLLIFHCLFAIGCKIMKAC